MARGRKEQIQSIIETLNSIQVGEIGILDAKLAVACDQLAALGESDLGKLVEEARLQLSRGALHEFRRLVAQAVARLGHVR